MTDPRTFGVHARVQVRWLAGIPSALVTGFFRAVIPLPPSMAMHDADDIEAILKPNADHFAVESITRGVRDGRVVYWVVFTCLF